jgi:uroporphyrinogen-III synthase
MQKENSSTRALAGLGVLVTRPAHQAEDLCRLIEAEGGRPIRYPLIEIQPPQDLSRITPIFDRLQEFQIAIFISTNAVQHGMRLVRDRGLSLNPLAVVAVGHSTVASLKELGVADPIVPYEASSEGVLALKLFQPENITGRRVLIFRGEGGRELLAERLRERGAEVEYAEVYRRVKPAVDRDTLMAYWGDRGEEIQIVLITSAEGLNNLLQMMGEAHRDKELLATPLLVMSERIAALAQGLGFKPVVAKDTSDRGLVEALKAWWVGENTTPTLSGRGC